MFYSQTVLQAFEEPELNEGEGINKRQRVIDILIQIVVEGTGFTVSSCLINPYILLMQ